MKTASHKDLKETDYNSITNDDVVRIIIPLSLRHIHNYIYMCDVGDRRLRIGVTYRFTA